jgi:hypothetical protein
MAAHAELYAGEALGTTMLYHLTQNPPHSTGQGCAHVLAAHAFTLMAE